MEINQNDLVGKLVSVAMEEQEAKLERVSKDQNWGISPVPVICKAYKEGWREGHHSALAGLMLALATQKAAIKDQHKQRVLTDQLVCLENKIDHEKKWVALLESKADKLAMGGNPKLGNALYQSLKGYRFEIHRLIGFSKLLKTL